MQFLVNLKENTGLVKAFIFIPFFLLLQMPGTFFKHSIEGDFAIESQSY